MLQAKNHVCKLSGPSMPSQLRRVHSRKGAVSVNSSTLLSQPLRSACAPKALVRTSKTTRRCEIISKAAAKSNVFLFGNYEEDDDMEEDVTVIKIQLGLFGDIRKFQRTFERAANLYDTDDEGALHIIYMESLTVLLRNLEYVGYASSGGKIFHDLDSAERKFQSISFEERAKFREETLTNVDGRRRKQAPTITTGDTLDSWLIITFVMALDGEHRLGRISSLSELRSTITTLAGVRADELIAFEVLWTPQNEEEGYTRNQLLTDYPTLMNIS